MAYSIINICNALLEPINERIKKYKHFVGYILIVLASSTIFLLGNQGGLRWSGEQALNLLWILLFLPIFAKVLGIRLAQTLMPLRKEGGILMGMLACVHATQFFLPIGDGYIPDFSLLFTSGFWIYDSMITSVAIGFFALCISTILLVTSNVFSMKKLGRNWKKLHRVSYLLIILVIIHTVLLKIERSQSIDYSIGILILYGIGKLLEWRGVTLYKRNYPIGQLWICPPCGYIYDPKFGDIDSGIEAGTEFVDIPDSWRCPVCGVAKADFIPYNEVDDVRTVAKVQKVTPLNPTTTELVIHIEDARKYRAGQYMTFQLNDEVGDFNRSYSIASSDGSLFVFLIKITEQGRGGVAIRKLSIGDTIQIRGPYGTFALQETTLPKIFIATGTGLAPIYAMIRSLPETIKKTLYFSVSTQEDMFYESELRNIQNLELHIHITKEIVDGFGSGRVDIKNILPKETRVEWYLCGNLSMIEQATRELKEHEQFLVYTEKF